MATGRYPFAEVERSKLIGAILHRPPRPLTALNPTLSPELERSGTGTRLRRHAKDADPDIPILKEAKAEYVKLQ